MRVAPNAEYPPAGHPTSHHFAPDQGRTLQEYQLLYIHTGRGWFESSLSKRKKVERGTVILLFPGVWHRYRPDRSTGWMESWIELNGPYMDHLLSAKIIDSRNPVLKTQAINQIENHLEAAHHLARAKPVGFPVHLGLLAIQILTLLRSNSARQKAASRRIDGIISEAQTIFDRNSEDGFSIKQIGRRLNVGYSYFRKEFKRSTGFSPGQYQIEIRHRRAKDLLGNSNFTIKEISERLGYYSPYHLSSDFSKRTGFSPATWRGNRAKDS